MSPKETEATTPSDAKRLQRQLVLNALENPGGMDTALTAADQPLAQGADKLNQAKRSE